MNQSPKMNSTVGGRDSRSLLNGLSLDLGAQQLHKAIHEIPIGENDEQLTQIDVNGSAGQDAVMMRLNHPIRIKMEGPLGDYAFAFNQQADIRMTGAVGSGVAEGMISGAVRVRGDAGVGAGAAMTGGTLAIYGNAGNRCGAAMRGGGVFVRGESPHPQETSSQPENKSPRAIFSPPRQSWGR